MAQGTLLPWPIQLVWNPNGTLSPGAKATFFLAGTSTPVAVYADVLLTTTLNQPVQADLNGRFPEIYGAPGVAVKMALTDSSGAAIPGYPADNILFPPTSASNQDVTGTAGVTLTAGLAVYLSDGSGGKTAGLWYLSDSANAYSSTNVVTGVVPATIASGSNGTIRLGGQVTGLTGLTVGTTYYVGTAGVFTTSVTSNSREIGQADSTTSIVMGVNTNTSVGYDFAQIGALF